MARKKFERLTKKDGTSWLIGGFAIGLSAGYSALGLAFTPGWANGPWPIDRRTVFAFGVCFAGTVSLVSCSAAILAYLCSERREKPEVPFRAYKRLLVGLLILVPIAIGIGFSPFQVLYEQVGFVTP